MRQREWRGTLEPVSPERADTVRFYLHTSVAIGFRTPIGFPLGFQRANQSAGYVELQAHRSIVQPSGN